MKSARDTDDNKLGIKIEFYILSLWLLFVLIFLLTVDVPISFAQDPKFVGIISLIQQNWLAIFSLIMALAGVVITFKLKHRFKGVHYPPVKITSIKNENYEYLTFLTTYIIPLICFDLNEIRYVIVLGILLLIIGSIFVKMDWYLGNPSLALLGYHLYRIKVDGFSTTEGILIISRDKLAVGSSIKWIKISDFVWVAKEHK